MHPPPAHRSGRRPPQSRCSPPGRRNPLRGVPEQARVFGMRRRLQVHHPAGMGAAVRVQFQVALHPRRRPHILPPPVQPCHRRRRVVHRRGRAPACRISGRNTRGRSGADAGYSRTSQVVTGSTAVPLRTSAAYPLRLTTTSYASSRGTLSR